MAAVEGKVMEEITCFNMATLACVLAPNVCGRGRGRGWGWIGACPVILLLLLGSFSTV